MGSYVRRLRKTDPDFGKLQHGRGADGSNTQNSDERRRQRATLHTSSATHVCRRAVHQLPSWDDFTVISAG
jgi:hypothetical protein